MDNQYLKITIPGENDDEPYLILLRHARGSLVTEDGRFLQGKAIWYTMVRYGDEIHHRVGIVDQQENEEEDIIHFHFAFGRCLAWDESGNEALSEFLDKVEHARNIDQYELMEIMDSITG